MSKKYELDEAEYDAILVICNDAAIRSNTIHALGGNMKRQMSDALMVMQAWAVAYRDEAESSK